MRWMKKTFQGQMTKKKMRCQRRHTWKITMMDLEEEEEAIELATQRSQMGSNNVNITPRKYGFAKFV